MLISGFKLYNKLRYKPKNLWNSLRNVLTRCKALEEKGYIDDQPSYFAANAKSLDAIGDYCWLNGDFSEPSIHSLAVH